MTVSKADWIKVGYKIFSLNGVNDLKIEQLSQKMGVSKSSFYHHFAEMKIFVEDLLAHHLTQSKIIAEKERNAVNINPDLITILVDHKIDLLFNRQLRFNQQNQLYKNILLKSNEIIGNEFIMLWAKDLNMGLTHKQLESLFELALENFFLQINIDNLNFEWIASYFKYLHKVAKNFE